MFDGRVRLYPPSQRTDTGWLPALRPAGPRSTTLEPTARYRGPVRRGRPTRLAIVTAFWTGLVGSVGFWWFDTPVASVDSVGIGLIEAGRITGMVAGYLLLVQVLMMSRVAWLDRTISANNLVGAHRDLGFALVLVVLLHVALTIVGYAKLSEVSLVAQTSSMLTTFEDMTSALVATGILVGTGLLAIRVVRARLPYELWHVLHLSTYAVLLLSYGHQFALGRELAGGGVAATLWAGGYLLVVACLVQGRLLSPLWFNVRHRLRVAEVVAEGTDVFSVYIEGRRINDIQARAGQFFRWRFMTRSGWWQAHPFSLSAAPNGHWLRLTIKAVGDHTEELKWLAPGVRVIAEGPSGVFTADHRRRYRALLMAAGSGIAPIRALLEDLPRGTVVIYRASSAADIIFRAELDFLADRRDAEIFYVLGGRDDPGPRRAMSPRGLRAIVPDVSRRDVYLCGPEGFVTAAVAVLRRLRVPRRQIHLDPFEF
ncbi:MAG TPA: ferredoxin reductase family protein [Jiangellales bacterium]|nr:ferredoxin reductase family protein [Jiangellales bacterium]